MKRRKKLSWSEYISSPNIKPNWTIQDEIQKRVEKEDLAEWALNTPDAPTIEYKVKKQKLSRVSAFSLVKSIMP